MNSLLCFTGPPRNRRNIFWISTGRAGADGVIEEVVGIEVGITEIVKRISMEIVGARAADQFHLAAGIAAVLGFPRPA